MVKKTSMLEKLKNRWKSASGVRVDRQPTSRQPDRRVNGSDPHNRLPAEIGPERASGRKLSSKEEAVVTMGEGFRELSTLVRGVHSRMENQGERAAMLAEEIRSLPALGRQQLVLLEKMAAALEQQQQFGSRLLASLGSLPETLQGVRTALERSAATDERTAQTLGEFRATMDRIDGAMGRMVESSDRQTEGQRELVDAVRNGREQDVQALGQALRESRTEDMAQLEKATERSMEGVRRAQQEHNARLDRLAKDGSRWSNVIVVLLALTFFTLAGILTVLLLR